MLRVGFVVAVLGAGALASAQPTTLPNTSIADTPANRAVLRALDRYRSALEGRDLAALMRLLAPDYRDDAGTPTPADDVGRAGFENRMRELFGRVEKLTFDPRPLRVTVRGDSATIEVSYRGTYRLDGRDVVTENRTTMELARVGGRWLFTSGL